MKDIKSGARANSNSVAMKNVMHLISDEEMAVVAKWLAGLK
jgi:cytochrome c